MLPTIAEVIDSDAPITENIVNVADIVSKKTIKGVVEMQGQVAESVHIINEFADLPEVELVTKKIIAPAIVSVSVVAIAPSFAGAAAPLVKFLFMQPLLFLGIRRRKNWGKVYNSLTKLPIELATIRLIDVDTNKIVQSLVTDQKGNYGFFIVPPGEYRIEVFKKNFVFPSQFLMREHIDSRMVDLYHGENLFITDNKINITPNIPVDPIEQKNTPKRIHAKKKVIAFQNFVAGAGIFASFAELYITNTWYIWLFLFLHIILYVIFLKFISPKKLKGWGVTYDALDKIPMGKTLVRLYNKEYDKQLDFQITDKKGRYAFLVGPNDYYVTFEKEGYTKRKVDYLKSKEKEKMLINLDVDLFKDNDFGSINLLG